MNTPHRHSGWRTALAAAALCCAASLQAAGGSTVSMAQQSAVQVGMSQEEVRGLLGRPGHDVKYRAEPGHTWTYSVVGGIRTGEETFFVIAFAASGRVLATGLRVDQMY